MFIDELTADCKHPRHFPDLAWSLEIFHSWVYSCTVVFRVLHVSISQNAHSEWRTRFWLTSVPFAILENLTFISSGKPSLLIFFGRVAICLNSSSLNYGCWVEEGRPASDHSSDGRWGAQHRKKSHSGTALQLHTRRRKGIEAVTAAAKLGITEVSR